MRVALSIGLAFVAFFISSSSRGLADITVEDPRRMKSVAELFRRSPVVAVVWVIGGVPETKASTWFVLQARVGWAFKGVLNNQLIYFRCREGCTLGQRYIVFLEQSGKTLGDIGAGENPVSAYPADAEYLVSVVTEGYPFPVFYEPRLNRTGVVVGFERAKAGLPVGIEQGSLECTSQRRLNWWADFEGLKTYLIDLATAPTAKHP